MSKMRVLVTGGSGFIGTHLVERLIEQSHKVIILDKIVPGKESQIPEAQYVKGDVRDEGIVNEVMEDVDSVFHLAAIIGIRRAMKLPLDTLSTNIFGAKTILSEASSTRTPVIMASSSVVYGKSDKVPLCEDDDITYGNLHVRSWTYSHAKLAEEALGIAYYEQENLPVKIFRMFNCVGPGQTSELGNVLPSFVEAAIHNETLTVHGDGTQTRGFIDVDDAIKGIINIFHEGKYGEVYNIGSERETRIIDLANMVIEKSNSESNIEFIPFEEAFGREYEEPGRRIADISKLKELGFSRDYDLEKTIERTIEWAYEYHDL